MSVSGDSFCDSAYSGFMLNLKHCVKFYFAQDIGSFFVTLGVVFITAINTLIFYGLTKADNPKKAEIILPMIAVGILSYLMCVITLGLFDDAVRATLMSYAVDCDLNNGAPSYGPPDFHKRLAAIVAENKNNDCSDERNMENA